MVVTERGRGKIYFNAFDNEEAMNTHCKHVWCTSIIFKWNDTARTHEEFGKAGCWNPTRSLTERALRRAATEMRVLAPGRRQREADDYEDARPAKRRRRTR